MKKLFTIIFLLTCFLGASAEGSERQITWQEWLTNDGKPIKPGVATESKYMGDAETPWPAWSLEVTDGINTNWRTDRAPEICAWALTMGINFDDECDEFGQAPDRARPYPADIEAEAGNESNHLFAVHVTQIDAINDEENSIQWSNQFWIQSPRSYKAGEQVRIKFRYKAEHACSVATMWNQKNPSVYLNWTGVGDVAFTDKWQDFEKTVSIDTDGTWSLAFNLTSDSSDDSPQEPNIFYFDDLSWQSMELEEGYFVAASNTKTGSSYDYDHAIALEKDPFDKSLIVATVGEIGKEDTYVNRLMISTVRGDDASFKGYTLKPSGNYIGEDNWGDYYEASNAKITLPYAGVWKISLDTEGKQINIVNIEGNRPTPPKPKCATPEISYTNGKITFSCETEGASYHYSITNDDCKTGSENNIQLCMTYKVYVYATKDGYNNSDVATREIVIENGQATLFGDINKDGKVNVADHVKLSDIIMNK